MHRVLSALILLCCFMQPAFAQGKVSIPIFYATDRELDNSGVAQYSTKQLPGDELLYGVKNVALVDDSSASESPDRLKGLGWWNPLPNSEQSAASFPNTTLTKDELLSRVKEVVDEGDSKRPLVLYVHGCCSDFTKTITDAARIEKAFAAPVVMYGWAAIPPLDQYKKNEIAQANSAHRFNTFLSALEDKVGADRLILVGYSMGNRFLAESLKVRNWSYGSNPLHAKFRCTNFMCADVPIYEFAANRAGIAQNSLDTFISKNNSDPALTVSDWVHGFYIRLGAPLTQFRTVRGTERITYYDTEHILRFKHDLPIDVMAQLHRRNETPLPIITSKYRLLPKKPDLTEVRN